MAAIEVQKAQLPKTRSSISENGKRAGTREGEGMEAGAGEGGDEVTEQDDAAHVFIPGVRRRTNMLMSGE